MFQIAQTQPESDFTKRNLRVDTPSPSPVSISKIVAYNADLPPLPKSVASFASASAAAIALYQPAYLSGSDNVQQGEIFYARMYAARSIPLGLAFGVLPFWLGGEAVPWILFTAAAVQLLDVGIALDKRDRGMMIGAAVGLRPRHTA